MRIILVITFFHAFTSNRPIIEIVSVVAMFVTFVPSILKNIFKIDVPAVFEIIYLMAVYGTLMLGELRGFYSGLWWWSMVTSLTASIALGFISLSIVHMLYQKNKIAKNIALVGILIFAFTVTLATFWELFEFTLDFFIHTGLQDGLLDTMQDISINILGALIVSIAGSFYMSRGKNYFVSTFFSEILEGIIHLKKDNEENPEEEIAKITRRGETERIEFKSSIRTNMHTMQFDKKMEEEILKTIVAFLNTNGGVLLIGVNDSGEIIGLEQDKFSSVDKIGLHLTNLIKSNIGNNFLPFIRFDVLKINNKIIVVVKCRPSKKEVFLKDNQEEKFYVRNGPASIKLDGSSLIDYIKHKFNNINI